MYCFRYLFAAWLFSLAVPVFADPCGMVPPVYLDDDQSSIARIGLQKTYVFFNGGIETFVIRPGFKGQAKDFGMLIPFPEPPAIRKVADDIFSHIEKAIDPPEVVIDLTPRPLRLMGSVGATSAAGAERSATPEAPLAVNAVRVLREEAVGMYQVAVLEAGSAAALKRWMDDHGYKYPTGMDTVCEGYVESRWCFVAIKTKVGPKSGVDPKPGMRDVKPNLPDGASFDGFVQAMGFRFHVKELVVPMRLSAFNAGELRNVVYLLTAGPRKIRSIPEEYIVRQIPGDELHRNIVGPLPLRVIGGTMADIPKRRRTSLKSRRDPARHNGLARELFGSDLLAAREKRLSHPHEEDEKVLLRIGEELLLRGKVIDRLNNEALKQARYWTTEQALADLKEMTLTVVDGDFPRGVLGGENLKFVEYQMPQRRNTREAYHAPTHAPTPHKAGKRYLNALGAVEQPGAATVSQGDAAPRGRLAASLLACLGLIAGGLVIARTASASRKPKA